MTGTRILLVEDDPSLGATLKERLIKEGYSVAWASCLRDGLRECQDGPFDLYVFDIGLPDGNGFDLARQVPPKPLIFLTARGDAESRLMGYEHGAEEYIPKPFHLRELLLRIRHVLDNHMPAAALEVGPVRIHFDSFTFERNGKRETVASKDLALLRLLVERHPNVVRRDEALNLLWGEDKFPSNRTVDNAILRLRGALAEAGACIESVRGVGYRWNPEAVEKKT